MAVITLAVQWGAHRQRFADLTRRVENLEASSKDHANRLGKGDSTLTRLETLIETMSDQMDTIHEDLRALLEKRSSGKG